MPSREQLAALEILGYVYFRQGRLDQAKAVFEGMLALEPGQARPRKHLAAIALAKGDAGEALLHLDAFMSGRALSSAELPALLMKAQAYWMAGRREEGIAALSEYTHRAGEAS